MRLSHQIERFLLGERHTTVQVISRHFGISRRRAMEELAGIVPFGVEVRSNGDVFVIDDKPAYPPVAA